MNRIAWLLTLAVAMLVGTIATRAQFETPNRAFHGNTAFPLTGRHQTVACESCHIKGVFKGTPTACYDCHWVRRQDDKFKTQLGTQCENCHRTIAWTAVRWDHGAMTNLPLNGAHRAIGCESCHSSGRFQKADVSCVSCHQKDYAATTSPNHLAAGFPMQCEACHRPSDVAFSQARFDHEATFPLSGTHATVACATCHRNNVFQGTPRDCIGCHRSDYERTAAPNHAAAGFPTTCEIVPSAHRPRMARCQLQPQPVLHAGRQPPAAGMHDLPQEQRLQGHRARLRGLPSAAVRADRGPEPRASRVPDDLRDLSPPDGCQLDQRHVQPQPASTRWPAGTPPSSVRSATRTTSSGAPPATASAAIAPTTSAPPRRTTRRPACRRRARAAIDRATRRGEAAASTTPRCSRWLGATRRRRARRVTSTESSRERPATASAATAASTTGRRRRATPRPVFRPSASRAIGRPTAPGPACRSTTTSSSRCRACTRRRAVPPVTRRRLQGHAAHVCRLPPGGLQRDPQSESRAVGIPNHVRELPPRHRHRLDARPLHPHAISADRSPQRGVQPVSYAEPAGVQLPDLPPAAADG